MVILPVKIINGFLDPVPVEIEFRIDVVVVVLKFLEIWIFTKWPVVKHSLVIRKDQDSVTIDFIKWWCCWTISWLGGDFSGGGCNWCW